MPRHVAPTIAFHLSLAAVFALVVPGCGGVHADNRGDASQDGASGQAGAGATGASGGRGGASGNAGNGFAGRAGTSGGTGDSAGHGGASGGMAGGVPGHGGAGGAPARRPECTTASDCKLVSDCCACEAIPVGEQAPACSLTCVQSNCAARQLPSGTVDCVAGRCVAGFRCDTSKVACEVGTPICAAGEVPTVNEAGTCYTGTCAPAVECTTVISCSACTGATACATYDTQRGPQSHCVETPSECTGNPAGCECLGQTSCVAPYGTCTPFSGVRGVLCSCPTC